MVFDARTGVSVSLNREPRRNVKGPPPGQSLEQLLAETFWRVGGG